MADKENTAGSIGILFLIVCLIVGFGIAWPSLRAQIEASLLETQASPSWKLVIHPAVGEPVELAPHVTQATCEAEREESIKKAVRQGQAIPSLTCVSTSRPWGTGLKQWLLTKLPKG